MFSITAGAICIPTGTIGGKNGCVPYGQKGVDGGSKWRVGMRETERFGWIDGMIGQQRNDCGCCV